VEGEVVVVMVETDRRYCLLWLQDQDELYPTALIYRHRILVTVAAPMSCGPESSIVGDMHDNKE
jgi:hypothetical protein